MTQKWQGTTVNISKVGHPPKQTNETQEFSFSG